MVPTDYARSCQQSTGSSPRPVSLTGVHFTDRRTCFAYCYNGWILRSDDGGKHWQEAAYSSSQTRSIMNTIQVKTGEQLAVGRFGLATLSYDDGLTWFALTEPTGQTPYFDVASLGLIIPPGK